MAKAIQQCAPLKFGASGQWLDQAFLTDQARQWVDIGILKNESLIQAVNTATYTFPDTDGINAGASSGYYMDAASEHIKNYMVVTWNPSDSGGDITFSGGDLTLTKGSVGAYRGTRATVGYSTGKRIYEILANTMISGNNQVGFGTNAITLTDYLGKAPNGFVYTDSAQKWNSNSFAAFGVTYTGGDRVYYAVDLDARKIWFGVRRASDTVTVDAGTDILTRTSHGLSVGDRVWFVSGGTLPGGLSASVLYYVKTVPSGNTFTLSLTSGGSTVDITSAGSGTHYLGRWLGSGDPESGANAAYTYGSTLTLYPFFTASANTHSLTGVFENITAPTPSGFLSWAGAPGNMTLRLASITTGSAPSQLAYVARFDQPDDDVDLGGGDIVIAGTRDGGTTFTNASIEQVLKSGTEYYIRGLVDVSAQPSGTSVSLRITTPGENKVEWIDTHLSWN